MIKRGKLIVLQGLDRSGKSSVTKYLCQLLSSEKNKTISMSFPDRTTPIGKMIDEFLNNRTELSNEAIHLLFSANRWQKMKIIQKTLDQGVSIVCDRYWYSGVAYSVAKGMNFEWCTWADKGLLAPDLIIFLRANPDLLSKRAQYGQQRFEKLEFQKKVKESFEILFEQQQAGRVHTIEVGELNLEEVQQNVKKIVEEVLK